MGTWTGSDCDAKCTAVGGNVCGRLTKDCCAMKCEKGTFSSSCQFGLKLTKKNMNC